MLQSYVSTHTHDAQAEARLSSLEAESGQREKSLRHAETALALAAENPSVLADLAETYDVLGDRQQALRYVHQSVKKGYTAADLQTRPGLQKLLTDPKFLPRTNK
jgi:Flp pilus assembly protein TadD